MWIVHTCRGEKLITITVVINFMRWKRWFKLIIQAAIGIYWAALSTDHNILKEDLIV